MSFFSKGSTPILSDILAIIFSNSCISKRPDLLVTKFSKANFVISITDTISAHPTDTASEHAYASISGKAQGYTDSSSTNYATINLTTGSGATTYIYYTFDFSEIPVGATIDSISCQAKCYISTTNSSRITTRQVQLFSGTTAKGSAYTVSNSTTAFTVSAGSWTRDELQDARIRIYAVRGSSNTGTTYYFRFYGATVNVTYSVNGTAYTIGATSNVDGITVSPSTQEVMGGEEAVVTINGSSIDDISVTDNDVDVTNQLEQHIMPTGGSQETDLGSYTLVSGSFHGSGATYFSRLAGAGIDHTQTTSNYYSGGSGTIAVFTYDLDFNDIPSNAVITELYCDVNGHAESTSNSNEYMCAQLISGSTTLSAELNFKSVGTSNSTQRLTATTLPTVAQLANLKLQCRLGYYGGAINGATCYITYEVPGGSDYYWTYTLTNIAADHIIIIDEAGAFIPPEEDPEYTYYPITISSINANTDPRNGTVRVQEGTTQVITISPEDPQLTLALDNGVDITSQLVGGVPTNTYTITTQVSGASYGFNLNSSTGYYVSSNDGISKSASVARLNMDFESDCLVTITYINYAEADYDYGMFGKLDTAVAIDGLTASSGGSSPSDSTSNYQIPMCSNSTGTQTVTYQVPAGEHFIDIKYGKDDASDSGNDSLQWKVTSVEATSAGGDYTYTLSNINQKHSLIFIFGDVDYYFLTSSGTNCKLYPDGQVVKLEGDSYMLRIVPNNANATVTIKDNNVDRTSLLEYEEGQDKSGNKVANYIYRLTNIMAAHNLIIICATDSRKIYTKVNGNWVTYSKVWLKVNGTWVEQDSSDWSNLFDTRTVYVKGNQ